MLIMDYLVSSGGGAGNAPPGHADLKQTRRRLSVMSDNTLIEGIDHVNISEEPAVVSTFYI